MEEKEIGNIIECLLFTTPDPIPLSEISSVLEIDESTARRVIERLQSEHDREKRGLEIVAIAGGYQMRTRMEYAGWIRKFHQIEKDRRLSRSLLETLAIVAYRQPATKPEIEAIRGVRCDRAIANLLEKNLIKIVGRRDSVGRPIMYGTTLEFLKQFGLRDISELPKAEELSLPLNDEFQEE
ncbi:MAG: SMC-Scp complex subunit ScpB [bacterium]